MVNLEKEPYESVFSKLSSPQQNFLVLLVLYSPPVCTNKDMVKRVFLAGEEMSDWTDERFDQMISGLIGNRVLEETTRIQFMSEEFARLPIPSKKVLKSKRKNHGGVDFGYDISMTREEKRYLELRDEINEYNKEKAINPSSVHRLDESVWRIDEGLRKFIYDGIVSAVRSKRLNSLSDE